MEGNSLETDEVVARGNGGRDGGRPGRVLVNHLARPPVPVADSSGDQAGLVNLELQRVKRTHEQCRTARILTLHTHLSVLALTPVQVDPGH